MSKSIEQIDALISKAVRNAKTERELAVKGLNFGRWWNEVGELDNAAKWVTKYLTIYDKDARAHKFLGEIYEKLDRSDAALGCYKGSLRVKPQQYELMLKVAEMHVNPGPTQDPGRAQVWLDKAAAALPNNPQVYKLKMELFLAQEAPTSKLEDTILEELKKRPADPSLYVQYVTFLKDQERLDEAFGYAQKTDRSGMSPKAVEKDLEWNQCLIDTCQEYAEKLNDDEVTDEVVKAYSLLLVSVCRHVWLCFEQEKYDDAIYYLAMLDSSVLSATSLRKNEEEESLGEWNTVLVEARGQLYWLAGIALIHFANQNEVSWTEAAKLSTACYAVSLSYPMADVSETWASWSRDTVFAERLKCMGGLRLSQSAHMMHNLAATSRTELGEENEVNEREWLRDVNDNFCTEEGRHKVFHVLFGQNYNSETSMIYCGERFESVLARLMLEEDLSEYDASAVLGADLRTWVWMGIQWRQNFEVLDPFSWISSVFLDLQLAPQGSVKHGNVWNLYRLDVESFIVACVLYVAKAAQLWKRSKPNLDNCALDLTRLPLPLGKRLVIEKQTDWWEAACKLHHRKNREKIHNINQVKAILRHGIEALRGSGNHGLQLALMAGLAKHFSAKAYVLDKSGIGTSSAAWLAYQRRAAHYWTLAHPLLQDVANNRARHITEPKDRLFPCTFDALTPQEARSMMSEVYMCNGGLLVQEGDLKAALETYGRADTPHASFCEALIFKQLVENCDRQESSLTPESSSKRREAFMKKCFARLEVTLSRLERAPDEELRRRVEAMIRDQGTSVSPSHTRFREGEPRRLFEDTLRKRSSSAHAGNRTSNSDMEDTVLSGPSRQSTPKKESRSQAEDLGQFARSLTTLTSALSTMQINIMERLNKVEQTTSPMVDGAKREQETIENMCDKLEQLTTVVSELQEKKEVAELREKTLQRQIGVLQEQLSRSHLGSPLQAFDQYQRVSLGQISSPLQPGGPFYNMPPYQGFLPQQSPSSVAMYAQQGYPSMSPSVPPVYAGQPRTPQPIIDPRDSRSPSVAGLPMSKEAADALSMRFQSSMGGRTGSMTPPTDSTPPDVLSRLRSASPRSQSISYPAAAGMDEGIPESMILRRMTHAGTESPHGLLHGPMVWPAQQVQPGTVPRPLRPTLQPQGTNDGHLPSAAGSMAPPGGTVRQEGRKSIFQSLFPSGQAPPGATAQEQPGMNYESKKMDETGRSSWNFRFQSPEEMDKDNKKLEADEEAEDAETSSHNDTGPHFEPLVTLPEVEVVTGEEEEEAIFSERAKLYRWHDGQWKERGIGTMKILKHRKNGKCRLLMRRDQVLKICCNQIIGTSLELKPMPSSDRAWMWHAFDFSEEGGTQEGFAIRFKSPEIANQFRQKFSEGREANAGLSGETPPRSAPTTKLHSSSPQQPQGVTPSPTTQPAVNRTGAGSGAANFQFSFANAAPGPALNLAMKIAGAAPKQTTEPPKTPDDSRREDEDVHNETGDGPHFEPVISLPDKVETKTGEEDEEVLFCHRAKLYRYFDKQWKERGLGDIKILCNEATKKFRIVMRREQVLKLCANHYISTDMMLAPLTNSDKAWTWTAVDHSDPDSRPQQEFLAVRFKLAETAAGFARNFNRAKDIIAGKAELVRGDTVPAVSVTSTTSTTPTFTSSAASNAAPSSVVTTQGRLVMKKEAGEWSCATCYSSNPATDLNCPCCMEPNPNAPAPEASHGPAQAAATPPTLKFSFGIPASQPGSTSFSFGLKSPAPGATASNTAVKADSIFGQKQTPAAFGSPHCGPFNQIDQEGRGGIDNICHQHDLEYGVFATTAPSRPSTVVTTGPLKAVKEPGNWSCPGCYSENDAADAVCPCCGSANPSAAAAAPPKTSDSGMKAGLFGLVANQKTTFRFGLPQSSATETSAKQPAEPGADMSQNTFGGTRTTGVPMPSNGPLIASNPPGKWSCSSCYAENDGSDVKCPCCLTENPSAPPSSASNVEKSGMMPGIFSMSACQPSSFRFGIPQSSTPLNANPSTAKFPFGAQSSGSFTFGTPSNVSGGSSNNVNGCNNRQPDNVLLSATLGSNFARSTGAEVSPKPRFPSVGQGDDDDDDDEEDEDSDESYESYESSEDDEDDYEQNRDRYRSPLNRLPVRESPAGDDEDDVVCLGEILPSEELQRKAESLMLPKHFYNFVKDGEPYDDGDSDTDTDKGKQNSAGKPDTATPPLPRSTQSTGGFFASSSSSSFAAIAAQGSDGFAFGGGSGGWVGMPRGKELFANEREQDTSQDRDEHYITEEGDNIHFEPVIKLPEKVETVTGEEDEETLFSQRCKLYRFNKPTNEWKERGLGEIKLLKHLQTGRIRIVMRREQVLKVCANHNIRPGMTLDANKTSDRAWTWTAMDHSDDDGEPKLEIFTARFKSVAIANEFKEKFDMCQTMLLDVSPVTPCKASSLRSQELTQKAERMKDELRFFKDKFSQPFRVDLENTLTDETHVVQEPMPPLGSLTPLVRQHAESLRDAAAVEQAGDGSIVERLSKPTSLLQGDNTFSFQIKTTSHEPQLQGAAGSSTRARENAVSVSSDDPQSEKEIHFEPVIALPEKVELVTGEEDEQVVFANRAKLYAFHKETGQWKERGLGDVKILQDLKTCKVRVLMRREQVFKVCLNHNIQSEVRLSFKDPDVAKTVMWTAKDYSDEENLEGEIHQFALRFKNSEFALSFKDLWGVAADAATSMTLLEPDPADINTSMAKRGVTSPGPPVPQSPESPVKQPTSTFSFANVPSPLKSVGATAEGPVNVMGFVFGKQPEKSTTSAGKFAFDTSKLSFSFGTSTPQIFGAPAERFHTPADTFSRNASGPERSLFATDTKSPSQSSLFTTASETTPVLGAPGSSSGGQSPVSQPLNVAPRSLFGTAESEYRPSPLAMSSDPSKSGALFSAQSGKFQFKPTSNDQISREPDAGQDAQPPSKEDDDVIFVSELAPSDDQRKRAEALLLPRGFFLYENKSHPEGYDEKAEDEKEEKVFKFIQDRDSGKLDLEKQRVTLRAGSGDQASPVPAKSEDQRVSESEVRTFGSESHLSQAFDGAASFADLATGVQNVGFKNDPSFQFPGAGQMLFQQSATGTEASDGQDPSLYKCDAQFKPVLDEPPPLVDVKTGEEGEEILFKERCKLYRYDTDAKAWKERGVGEIKILRNDEYTLHRVVMRRDQVFKVCTNHVVTENTNPEPHLGSSNSCSYFVMDYSENKTPKPERIAIRFKTDGICKQYMDKIAEVKASESHAS